MKLTISTKWFLWLSVVLAIFCIGQILGMLWLEVWEVRSGAETLSAELEEIVTLAGVSFGVFLLMIGGLYFVSKRMIKPIRLMAKSAQRISAGELDTRLEGELMGDEMGMLATTINDAFDRYREALQRIDEFSGNAAHQLRTPLASIRSIGEVCLQNERDSVEYKDCIGSMLEVVQDLSDVVEKLLMMARMDKSVIRQGFLRVSLSDVIEQIFDIHEGVLQDKNIETKLLLTPGAAIWGDTALIREAITNVLENAMSHTPEGGRIHVEVKEEANGTAIEITDTGEGFPEEERLISVEHGPMSSLMDELPAGRLGLKIVSQIMRIHDGVVELSNLDGGGARVRLFWPNQQEKMG